MCFSKRLIPLILILYFLALIVVDFHVFQVVYAYNPIMIGQNYMVEDFNVTLTVYHNNTVNVVEVIRVYFINLAFKSFTRSIYIEGFEDLKINNVYSIDSNITSVKVNKALNLREITIDHVRDVLQRYVTFVIEYNAYGVLTLYDSDRNRFSWPVVSYAWNTFPFDRILVTVILPRSFNPSLIECDPKAESIIQGESFTKITFYKENLKANAGGFYINVIFPKITEVVREPFIFEDQPIESALLISFFTTLVMFTLYYFKGRIPRVEASSYIYSSGIPSHLKPIEVAYLVNRRFGGGPLLSTIIELARSGDIVLRYDGVYLHFIETSKGKLFSRYKVSLKDYEKELIDVISKAGDSYHLQTSFWPNLRRIAHMVEDYLVKEGYFSYPPSKLRRIFLSLGLIISGVGLIMLLIMPLFGEFFWNLAKRFMGLFFGLIMSSAPIILIGYLKFTSYTPKGAMELNAWKTYIEGILNPQTLKTMYTLSEERFEEDMMYIVAIIPHRFYDWAMNFIGKLSYVPKWIEFNGGIGKIEPSTEGYVKFINIMGTIVKDFIEDFPHIRYLKLFPYPI